MSNNLVVDVAAINAAIANVNLIYNEASKAKHWIQGARASALQINNETRDLRIEANTIPFSKSWGGNRTSTVYFSYSFKNSFATWPVVSVTYDGAEPGVTTRIEYIKDRTNKTHMDIFVTRPGGAKWDYSKDHFAIHILAIGY